MQENIELINRIYDYVETGYIDKAVFACMRLSRNMQDIFNTIIFLRELYPDKKQFTRTFYEEAELLNEDAKKYLWEETLEHWIAERTISLSLIDEDHDKNVLGLGVGELKSEVEHIQEIITDLKVPSGMGQFDTAAFTDKYDTVKSKYRLRLFGISTVLERIRTRCLNYASRIEHQIQVQQKPREFLSDVQNTVNNFFSARSEDAYNKLQKASVLVASNDPEDFALLLTSVRRSTKAIADYFYPPQEKMVICSDGVERSIGNDEYLNRLHEFCSITFKSSTSNDLIQAELNYLMSFARKLNNIANKGVHSEVTSAEAKQGLVGLYMFLFNVIQKIEE
jgi:hypothetical protein